MNCQVLFQNKELIYAVVGVAYAGLEFWLGKTDKVKAASALEALLNVMKKSPEDSNGKAL